MGLARTKYYSNPPSYLARRGLGRDRAREELALHPSGASDSAGRRGESPNLVAIKPIRRWTAGKQRARQQVGSRLDFGGDRLQVGVQPTRA